MIRINRPSQPPGILRKQGAQATQELCDAFAAGVRDFTFYARIYGAKSVKAALRKAQHDKCAFCESRFTHCGYGDVEHFRPKAASSNAESDELTRPGYYWLAYQWANLFFSCQLCNQRFKRNLFPLKNPRRRARSHQDSLDQEQPLLIDPAVTDPADDLGFRKEYVYARNGGRRGQTTIDVLGLNRAELVEVRRDRLKVIQLLCEARNLLAAEVVRDPSAWNLAAQLQKVDNELKTRTKDSAEYAAMVRAYLAGSF